MITYRRILLDAWLADHAHLLRGRVVDIGGKRKNKRGQFEPPIDQAEKWLYVNIDAQTEPDLLADAAAIPLPTDYADAIICTETLEHVSDPKAVVSEIYRLLKPGGVVVGSVPFLYPVHADPYDFQRFAPEGLRWHFSSFSSVELTAMGGAWGTLALLLELVAQRQDGGNRFWRALRWRVARKLAKIGYWLDSRSRFTTGKSLPAFTTGYGFVAYK